MKLTFFASSEGWM